MPACHSPSFTRKRRRSALPPRFARSRVGRTRPWRRSSWTTCCNRTYKVLLASKYGWGPTNKKTQLDAATAARVIYRGGSDCQSGAGGLGQDQPASRRVDPPVAARDRTVSPAFWLLDPAAVQLSFAVGGVPARAPAGSSVAGALLLAGYRAIRRAPADGSPRGPYCMMGACHECPRHRGRRAGLPDLPDPAAKRHAGQPGGWRSCVTWRLSGPGPAGLAAAATAAGLGVDTVLVDEQSAPGGHIYRGAEAGRGRATSDLGSGVHGRRAADRRVPSIRRRIPARHPGLAHWPGRRAGLLGGWYCAGATPGAGHRGSRAAGRVSRLDAARCHDGRRRADHDESGRAIADRAGGAGGNGAAAVAGRGAVAGCGRRSGCLG